MSVENLFGDETHSNAKPIHIRIQSRNGRKCISSISGLENDLDLIKICNFLKKTFGVMAALSTTKNVVKLLFYKATTVKKLSNF